MKNIIYFFYNNVIPYFTPNVSITLLVAFGIFFIVYRQRKKRVPKEVTARLNYNFYNALTVIEKELLQVLYRNHQKGEVVSIKIINKIIGVQNKDILTQNKSRSDHFLKINQKLLRILRIQIYMKTMKTIMKDMLITMKIIKNIFQIKMK